jgi:putative oxidoreductase
MDGMKNWGALFGRIMMGSIFVGAGVDKFGHLASYTGLIAKQGLPMAGLLAFVAALVELGGGAFLIVGAQARWAALLLFLFLIPATLIFHAGDQVNTMKNLAIMGGMLMVATQGGGGFSWDTFRGIDRADA